MESGRCGRSRETCSAGTATRTSTSTTIPSATPFAMRWTSAIFSAAGYTPGMLFETRAGPLRLRWNERGLTAIEMPELPPRALRAELAKQDGAEVPLFVREAARLLERHLSGEAQDLAALPLDISVLAPFQRAVYEKVRDLPPGLTATYGEIAALLGKPGASRAVGQALGRNPFLVAIPCHRVLAAGGAPGGFSAPGGVIAKQRLLAITPPGAENPPG